MYETRQQMREAIYEILQRSEESYGLLSPTKVNDLIQDSFDYLSSLAMNTASYWLVKTVKLDVVAEQELINLPRDVALILEVKKQDIGSNYFSLPYYENSGTVVDGSSSDSKYYSIVNNSIRLSPKPRSGKTDGIMLFYQAFPGELLSDSQQIDDRMNAKPFLQFVKWRTVVVLYSLLNDGARTTPFDRWLAEWEFQVQTLISKRIAKPGTIQSFTDY